MTSNVKHCVITGAAYGIGRELSLAFARAGYAIAGIDRDVEHLQLLRRDVEAAGGIARILEADLGTAGDLTRLIDALGTLQPVHVFIHNAGISAVGAFETPRISEHRAVIDVNLLAPMVLTNGPIGRHLLADDASLVFISSLSHFVGYPGAAAYAASKDGLHAYASSLAASMPKMHVLTIYPGPTRTAHAHSARAALQSGQHT
ncbi:MAG: SDR family oxidoreductase [Gemmatimonadaceae bacterium]